MVSLCCLAVPTHEHEPSSKGAHFAAGLVERKAGPDVVSDLWRLRWCNLRGRPGSCKWGYEMAWGLGLGVVTSRVISPLKRGLIQNKGRTGCN